jgi:hypothetical protein
MPHATSMASQRGSVDEHSGNSLGSVNASKRYHLSIHQKTPVNGAEKTKAVSAARNSVKTMIASHVELLSPRDDSNRSKNSRVTIGTSKSGASQSQQEHLALIAEIARKRGAWFATRAREQLCNVRDAAKFHRSVKVRPRNHL